MAVTFAQKLERMPHYEAGLHADAARRTFGSEDVVKLASNESPWGPHPAVVDAVARAAKRLNRYPDQHAIRLRRRIAERFDADPARVAVGNGSCEILLAAAEALCEPGDELLFAWPSFSMYPHLAALSGAREIRVPLADGYVHDLEAMLTEITAATQLVCVCNPNNPTATHLPAARIADFCARVPDHVTVALDEAYVEFQLDDDPDATVDLLGDFPNLMVVRTFSKVYGLAGLRCGYALCGARLRAALDAVRQPFSVNELAQVAAAEAILHGDDVAERVERTIVERVFVEEGVREAGLEPPDSQANFSWIPLGERDEGELVRALGEAGIVVRGGEGLGAPGHARVTYGTHEENRRFLDALRAALD
ncbi:MAG TPA: histidinol-phosphate transaminase [Solirubrobacterales bacterium]|nr:histidinol-phosphate transaminase [Solirubrobacterales bacterium]